MRASAFLTAVFAAGALAIPQNWNWFQGNNGAGHPYNHPGYRACLNDTAAEAIVNRYKYLLEKPQAPDFSAKVYEVASPSFHVVSDSILTLSNRPVSRDRLSRVTEMLIRVQFGQDAYPSRDAFAGSGSVTPPLPNITTVDIFHNCNKISWRWYTTNVGPVRVSGIIDMDVNATTHQINAVYSEFNSGAFWINLGNPECKKS